MSSGKICVICGEDCSGRPRTKDAKGRYYCQGCHEAARAKHAAAIAALSPAPELDETFSFLEELDEGTDASASPMAPEAAMACPGCGQLVSSGAAICTSCGASLAGAPDRKTRVGVDRRGAAWPTVIGIIALVFGGLGALLMTASVVLNALAGDGGEAVGSAISLVFSLWHASGGYGVLRRQRIGITRLKWWAVVKVTLVSLCGSLLVVALLLSSEVAEEMAAGSGLDAGFLAAIFGAILVAHLAWPVFLLIWFRLAGVRAEYERW